MSKTFQALEKAEKEYQANRQKESAVSLPIGPARLYRQTWSSPGMRQYETLKANLLARCSNGSVKTLLFVGTTLGDGATTTAINFAKSLARDSDYKILLIDADLRTPSLHSVFKLNPAYGLPDAIKDNGRGGPLKVGRGGLHVLPCGALRPSPVTLFESEGFEKYLKKMRDSYDYVILDAPPVHAFPDCRLLCSKVDGVILVVESGKTRRQVALSAKRQLEEAGSKILGVVLNQRRYYIPEFVYKRL